jgi:hypothetical protein
MSASLQSRRSVAWHRLTVAPQREVHCKQAAVKGLCWRHAHRQLRPAEALTAERNSCALVDHQGFMQSPRQTFGAWTLVVLLEAGLSVEGVARTGVGTVFSISNSQSLGLG